MHENRKVVVNPTIAMQSFQTVKCENTNSSNAFAAWIMVAELLIGITLLLQLGIAQFLVKFDKLDILCHLCIMNKL
jgi:hypothetical protein